MGIKIKWETAENMMNIVAFTACQSFIDNDEELDLEAIQQFARDTFEEYCEAMGITEVEEPEEEDDWGDEFDEEVEDEDEMESIIYDCDGHRSISEDDAHLMVQCVVKTLRAQMPCVPEEVLSIMVQIETLRIAEEWGIEGVDVTGE
jgi:hypothetical protein